MEFGFNFLNKEGFHFIRRFRFIIDRRVRSSVSPLLRIFFAAENKLRWLLLLFWLSLVKSWYNIEFASSIIHQSVALFFVDVDAIISSLEPVRRHFSRPFASPALLTWFPSWTKEPRARAKSVSLSNTIVHAARKLGRVIAVNKFIKRIRSALIELWRQ